MNERLHRLHRLLTTMQGQRALVLWRVVAGCTMLAQLLAALPQRHFLFGRHGVYPIEYATSTSVFGLYSMVDSPLGFELLFFGTIAAAVVWTLGLALPVSTVVVLVLWKSTFDRLPGLADGGDNLTHLMLIYALLTNLGGSRGERWLQRMPRWCRDIRAMVHNTGVAAMWIQVCIVYFIAGAAKLHGEAWRNGTALYYALGTSKYSMPGLVDPLLDAPVLLTLLAYATLVFQVGFPFLVALNPYSRRIALAIALSFHFGIATVMGLTTFAFFMIAADLTFLTDVEIEAASVRLRRVWFRVRPNSPLGRTPINHNNEQTQHKEGNEA